MAALHLTQDNFENEVIKSSLPVLVDFWAEWCGPCRMMGPVIEEVAKDLAGKLKVGKLNVEEAQDIAGEYNVMSIPTLIVFKNGKAVDQFVGAMPKELLIKKIQAHL